MAYKKSYRKRRQVRRYRKRNYGKRLTLIKNPISRITHQPFPPRYRTCLSSCITGYFPSGASTYVAGVNASNPAFPWDLGGLSLTLPNIQGTANNATLIQCAGFNQLCNPDKGPYICYRVYAASTRITIYPQSAADAIHMSMAALDYDSISTLPHNNPSYIGQIAFGKGPIICTGNNNIKMNTLKLYHRNYTVLGVSKRKFEDDNIYNVSEASDWPAPDQQVVHYISLQNVGGTNLTNNLAYEVKTKYYIEFYNYYNGLAPIEFPQP